MQIRYIELNPVRAAMVKDPAHYSWSSYQSNGLGKQVILLTPYTKDWVRQMKKGSHIILNYLNIRSKENC